MARPQFGWGGFALRLIFALVLVGASYNPHGYSFYHWGIHPPFGPEKALVGLLLLVGWIIYLRATFRSLGPFGIALALAVFGAVVWLLIDRGWLAAEDPTVLHYVGLVGVALVLAVGMSWSYVRRRLSGQVDVDDVEDLEQ